MSIYIAHRRKKTSNAHRTHSKSFAPQKCPRFHHTNTQSPCDLTDPQGGHCFENWH